MSADRKPIEFRPFGDVDAAFRLPERATKMDLWDAWAFAAVECALALEAWTSAPHAEKELGYRSYLAALDREEQAAAVLARAVDPGAAQYLRAA
jgi:hypothetical protein